MPPFPPHSIEELYSIIEQQRRDSQALQVRLDSLQSAHDRLSFISGARYAEYEHVIREKQAQNKTLKETIGMLESQKKEVQNKYSTLYQRILGPICRQAFGTGEILQSILDNLDFRGAFTMSRVNQKARSLAIETTRFRENLFLEVPDGARPVLVLLPAPALHPTGNPILTRDVTTPFSTLKFRRSEPAFEFHVERMADGLPIGHMTITVQDGSMYTGWRETRHHQPDFLARLVDRLTPRLQCIVANMYLASPAPTINVVRILYKAPAWERCAEHDGLRRGFVTVEGSVRVHKATLRQMLLAAILVMTEDVMCGAEFKPNVGSGSDAIMQYDSPGHMLAGRDEEDELYDLLIDNPSYKVSRMRDQYWRTECLECGGAGELPENQKCEKGMCCWSHRRPLAGL